MSDAKSTPFVHVIKSKYTPKVTKKLTIRANNAKFANHFHGKWNSQNLQRIVHKIRIIRRP